ncbi:response regulator transcription factor [Octadecabacter sp. 1_MG-2023]|uniref:response regulator n=1 Tax=unclassified Octadecabacter TaxID=196158 RepID=UPI001C09FC03|nr:MULTISPECIES: response regulator transcription factor [unclassified Octadecabacter]MBU2994335.1 response regulator transcription factor [Octadecabacter sp. B2R22]MDO6734376.1 response regulator transcription factor [Octadecabacter sp. 1_MG-2023]
MVKPTAVIADDHTLIRNGIQQILMSCDLDVVAQACDGLEAIAMVRSHQPQVLTLDLAMPYSRGIEVFSEVRRWSPDTKIIVFSGLTSVSLISNLAQSGADAIFLKRGDLSAFSDAIPKIVGGDRIMGPGVSEMLDAAHNTSALTARELQILSLVSRGFNNRDIAERLGLSTKTIDNHRTNLMRKIQVHSTAELIAYALREGLLDASLET